MIRNMDFNIAAALMLVIVLTYFITQYDTKTKSSKAFLRLLACIFATAVLNVVCDYLLTVIEPGGLLYTLYSVYILVIVGCAFIFCEYTRTVTSSGGKPILVDKFNYLLMFVYLIACFVSVPLHIFVTLENKTVIRGNAYIFIYLISGYYLVFSSIRMVMYFDRLSKRQVHGVLTFAVVTFSGALLQYFVFGDQMLIYFIYALSSLILLFAFETPDYQRMIKATEALRVNKEALEVSKEREDNLNRTVHQLMKTASWVIYFDKDGNLSEAAWSEEIKTLLGYSLDDDIDTSSLWTESLHPDDKDSALGAFMRGMKGEDYRIETRLRNKDGSYHWFLCTGDIVKNEDGTLNCYQGIIQNIDDDVYKRELITERLKTMAELEKSQDDLKKALFNAEEANRAKTTFLSNMSHDIRTPMNAIIGYTQLATEQIDKKEEVLDCLNTIKSSGDHLLSLINDVLDMSRIESGKVKVENSPCNLSELIKDIEALTKANVDERNQTYETIIENLTDPYVMCDRLRLNQVLINCVGNAVKYTKEGGSIKVVLSQNATEKDGVNEYVFKVIDNGIGMSEEFLKHVFEPFERAKDSTASSIQGTGLGMAITQNLINMMGGEITAESELGKGSTFIVKIPLSTIKEEDYEATKEKVNDGTPMEEMIRALEGKHFLVVDDNKLNRTVVKRLLGERGMIIDECESGIEAIEIAKTLKEGMYDTIFMDVKMPVMGGYEATDNIRSLDNEIAKTIPIIAMTANAFEEDKREAKEHGMNGHITKPFKVDELIGFLYELLR